MSWPSIVIIAVAVAVDIMLVPAFWLWDRIDDLKEKERT
jgi:hypothetical protein